MQISRTPESQRWSHFSRRRISTWLAHSLVVICLAVYGRSQLASGQERKIPLPPLQEHVDYRQPPRQYTTTHVGKWTIMVEKQLEADAPAITRQALARLTKKLGETVKALPDPLGAKLQTLRIFLMYGPKAKGGGRDNGLEYVQKNAPECYKQLDPSWGDSVVIYSAENYVQISEFWALKALVHEFAHAHQLERWPEDQPDILRAWKNAVKHRLHHEVKDDQGKTLESSYAVTNQLEYFAELSCMYFVGCNYQPFNRKELKAYDPVGYAMIEKMWGLTK
jgi:hypothetical protein